MFSLIITIISVALVAALALATLFYGGDAYESGQAKAEAAKLRNQGQQLVAAAEFYYLQKGEWPETIQKMVDDGFLTTVPVAQRAAIQEALAGKAWVMPVARQPLFTFDEVTAEVCSTVNQDSYGLKGILPKLQPGYMHQCFGPNKNDLLVVVGRGSLPDLVAAVNEGLLVPENVSYDPIPDPDDTGAWTAFPGEGAGIPETGGQEPPVEGEDPPPGGGDEPPAAFELISLNPSAKMAGDTFSLYVHGTGIEEPFLIAVDGVTRSASVTQDATRASVSISGLRFGTHKVTVSNGGGAFVEAGVLRSLVSLSATSGFSTGGYDIVISGAGFDSNTRVFFGASEAQVVARTSTSLTVTVPQGPTNTAVDIRIQQSASVSETDLVVEAGFSYQGEDLSQGTVTTLTYFTSQGINSQGISYSPTANKFVMSSTGSQGMFSVDHVQGAGPVRILSVQSSSFPVASSPVNEWVFAGSSNSAIRRCSVFDCTGTVVAISGFLKPSSVTQSASISGLKVSPSGNRLLGWASNVVFARAIDAGGNPLGDAYRYYPLTPLGAGYAIRDLYFDTSGNLHLLTYNATTYQMAVLVYTPDFQTLLSQRTFALSAGANSPSIAALSDGRVFVSGAHAIYHLPASGEPILYAGYPGQSGSVDAVGSEARFSTIAGIQAVGDKLYVYTRESAIRVVN